MSSSRAGATPRSTSFRPVQRSGWARVKYFFYNPENGAIFTRTPKSWFLALFFYLVFYISLGTFWMSLFQIALTTMNTEKPKLTLDHSLIGSNPGVGVHPGQASGLVTSSLFYVRGNWNQKGTLNVKEDSDAGYAARMQKFFNETYVNGQDVAVTCNESELAMPRPAGQKPCRFEPIVFGDCALFPFGFFATNLKPCVILKMNKIFNLVPVPFTTEDAAMMDDLPENLRPFIGNPIHPRRIYVDCQGERSEDKVALRNNIKYFPSDQGIPLGYFPHSTSSMSASPGVAVQFINIPRGQVIHVECRLWFKEVVHDPLENVGMSKFSILIDHVEV
jgi:sodium/potassium-transporting ATPase subunit beta